MFTLRCTKRLTKRLGSSLSEATTAPTTRLGDWYANLIHVGRIQVVLAVSERTFLPVVVAAAPISGLVPRLRHAICQILGAIGVTTADIETEDTEMAKVAYGKTASRQVTGVMVDFAHALSFYLDPTCGIVPNPVDLAVKLSETPLSPLYKTTITPNRATLALFAARGAEVLH